MSHTSPNPQPLASLATALGPRGSIAALIVVHFALSILHVWPFPVERLGESWWWLPEMLIPALDAIPQAQIALIALYVTLGSGRWLTRVVRGALLLLWLELGRCQKALGLIGPAQHALAQANQLQPHHAEIARAISELGHVGLFRRWLGRARNLFRS